MCKPRVSAAPDGASEPWDAKIKHKAPEGRHPCRVSPRWGFKSFSYNPGLGCEI